MNLLGLEVKKVSYCEKSNKKTGKNIIDLLDDNVNISTKEDKSMSRSHIRRTINCETAEEFSCRKIGITHR